MSLHAIVRDLGAALKAKGCHYPVVYGPERTKAASYGPTRVVVERPRSGGADATGPVRSQRRGATLFAERIVAAKVTAYARSSVTGARVQDHEDLAERLCTVALSELDTISRTSGFGPIGFGPAGLFTVEDLADSEVQNGAAYAQEVTITSGLARLETTWAELQAGYAEGVEKPGALEEVTLGGLMLGGPALTFSLADSSITRSFGSWEDDGFAVGEEIAVSGSASNNVTASIATLTATVLTLSATALVDEGPAFGCAVATTTRPGFHAADTTLDASSTTDP